MKNLLRSALLATLVASTLPALASEGSDKATLAALDKAIAGQHRDAKNSARDVYRHPKETLAFFGLKADMTVVEIAPGSGWYTEILAPVLAEKGTLYAAHQLASAKPDSYAGKSLAKYKAKLASSPVYAKVKLTEFAPPEHIAIAPKGSADLVLTFRNVHNWMENGGAEAAFKGMYDALKPGGVLGVVEHRLPVDRPQSDEASSGYVKESTVIAFAEQAGFKLVGNSDINANPKDSAQHPKGVWSLPPSLSLGETDKAKYLTIGESDRMTLKFVKEIPADSAAKPAK